MAITCDRTFSFPLERLLQARAGVSLMQVAIKRAESPVAVPVQPEKQWLLKRDQMCQNQSE